MEGKEKKGETSQREDDPRGGRKGKKNRDRGWKPEAGQPGRPAHLSWVRSPPHRGPRWPPGPSVALRLGGQRLRCRRRLAQPSTCCQQRQKGLSLNSASRPGQGASLSENDFLSSA